MKDNDGNVIYYDEISRAAHRPYAYMPIVAGGTSFMYHLDINGQRVTNLNLTGDAIAKIFTGVITFWDDPEIKATNPTIALPHLAVRPVIRSDGSGTSAQFTAYMANQTPAVWNAFCAKVGIHLNPCPSTSLYPPFNGAVAQQYSDGVAGYVASSYANGAITYVEYGYAKQRGFPVANLQNKAGYFAQPVAAAVSLALQAATFNADGTQNLIGVYNNPDKRAYPMSSYSYMIVPTTTAKPFTTDKGATLGAVHPLLRVRGPAEGGATRLRAAAAEPRAERVRRRAEDPRRAEATADLPVSQPDDRRHLPASAPASGRRRRPPTTRGEHDTARGQHRHSDRYGGQEPTTGGRNTNRARERRAGTGKNDDAKGAQASGATTTGGRPAAANANIAAQDPTGVLVSNLASVTLPKTKAPVPLLFYVAAGLAALLAVFGPAVFALWMRRGHARR